MPIARWAADRVRELIDPRRTAARRLARSLVRIAEQLEEQARHGQGMASFDAARRFELLKDCPNGEL